MRSPDSHGRARGAHGPPLIGRSDLLDRLTTTTADGTSVVLRGPAGVGKTRLAGELCRRRPFAARAIDRVLASPGTASLRLGTLASLAPVGGLPSDDVTTLIGWFTRRWRQRLPT